VEAAMRCQAILTLSNPDYSFNLKPQCPWEAENGHDLCYKCRKYDLNRMEPYSAVQRVDHMNGRVIWEPR
jgi:hypothetical protein